MFRWRGSKVFVISLCAGALLAQQGKIRVNVNLVHAVATVKTQAGQIVGTLEKEIGRAHV